MDLLMMMRKGSYILVIALFMLATANSQKLCNHTTQTSPKSNASYIENFSTVKCLRVDGFGLLPNSKVVLDECSYWKTPSKDQEFSLTDNPLGKTVLKTNGNNRENFCLTIRNGVLQSSTCRSSDFDQSWTLKKLRDNGNQFLIEQYSTKKCLIPKSRETGTTVKLVPCNSFETEQIWKICN